ncbi:N5-glutamine methyltransferase family protein [Caldimonas brevitalea]|uniref:Release factor glutamine methyltransferase n=1 Tax=Caldimonas brevitalea TaxID=413882 RepID=A0A0G3BNZ1_9BURK|nr:HemK/PrmC family methyltransferase [Caldimonas brevitalea]AKJ31122.1 release factor glutamine methyltransferase [Caldimonas brevitalea]
MTGPALRQPADTHALGEAAEGLFAQLSQALQQGLQQQPDKPEETPANTLRALWHLAAGRPLSAQAAAAAALPPLTAPQRERLHALVGERLAGRPLAHLTGRQHFMAMELLAGPEALIPRRETELLGRTACALLGELVHSRAAPVAIDVCTGSGNLALALAGTAAAARVYGADLSPEALDLARRNADHLGLSSRIDWRCCDLLDGFDPELLGEVDLLVCNPPYISSGRLAAMPGEIAGHEPRLAFDGGPLGIALLNRLVREAPRFLRAGGWLAVEVGLGQGRAMQQRLEAQRRFRPVRPVQDEAGETRVLAAQLA